MSTIWRLTALLIFAAFMLYIVEWWVTRPPPRDFSSGGLLAKAGPMVRSPPYAFQFKCGTADTGDCYTYADEIWPR